MGKKKKKSTGDHREIVSDIQRQQDQDALRTSLQPTFEGTTYVPPILQTIDYVNVRETVGASQTNGPPPDPSLELHLDSTFTDTSAYNTTIVGSNINGFILPGKFGTAGWRCNYPTTSVDQIGVGSAAVTPPPRADNTLMDTSIGFSVSLWVFPQDLTALSAKRCIAFAVDDTTNAFSIVFDSGGIVYFFVKKAGTDYKRQISGLVTGSWQHIAATFNGATNTPEIYRNAVAGVSSVAAVQYGVMDGSENWMQFGYDTTNGVNSLYRGYYDEIRYYKSAVLTSTQITNLMNTNAP